MNKLLTQKLVDDAEHTIHSDADISESLKKQQKLMQTYGETPLLFFRKYVGMNETISLDDFVRVSFISKSAVKRYASSSKRLVSESRKRVAYGLMYFWKVLEQKNYEDIRDVMVDEWNHGKIMCVPSIENMKRKARESLWKEYHAAFHEDAEMAWKLAEDPHVLVRLLYNYRYKIVPLKGHK